MKNTAAALVVFSLVASADEGMWLFNRPPAKALETKYHFQPTPQWLEHLQKSSVRFNNGGSGSFVSADGLVMTNHHVGSDCIQKLSTEGRDYIRSGFHARTRQEELPCKDLELNVLMSIEDVTDRVNGAVTPGMDAGTAQKARRAVMNTIEKESLDRTGLRSDVVTLYNGGQYHLYGYKRYTDVRLVFAPERDIAFFGGDPDNFEYPRYDLDISFFRVYEKGKAVQTEHYLKWSEAGAKEGDLIFVSGNPGRTERLDTVAHLEFLRGRVNPTSLNTLRRREVLLRAFGERSIENMRRAQDDLFAYQNSRKARLGMLAGLQDPAIMDKEQAAEKALRDAVQRDPRLREAYAGAWDEVSAAIKAWSAVYNDFYLLENANAFYSELFRIARTLVRLAEETSKPNDQRLREYGAAALESLKLELFSEAPIYPDLETVELADSLGMLVEWKGAEDDLVRKVLGGKSPRARAAELVVGSHLADVKVRKQLAEAGWKGIEASSDPMIQLARLVDEPARKVRKVYEEGVQEPMRQAYAKIARARFALYGTDLYPDATFTLRLSYGEVKGYSEGGQSVPWSTTIGGAFEHAKAHEFKDPFRLPESWMKLRGRLKGNTPFNFVNTADIIGGNSGSPVVNRNNELVGIIFDGNIESLVLDYVYTEDQARAVAVHSAGILEALRKIYSAQALVGELTGGRSPARQPSGSR